MNARDLRPNPLFRRLAAGIDPGILVVLVIPLFAILPLLAHPGLPNTADGPAHLMRQVELDQAWQEGEFFPRWAPDLAYGYGAPLFSYAPPFLYFATEILHVGGLPLDTAMKGVVILMLLAYSLGAYLLVRSFFGGPAGVIGAAAYMYAPYRLREVFIQGNYGQLCGLAFYPWILWAFGRVAATGRVRYLLAASASLALLLLSHNISAMLFLPVLAAFLFLLLIVDRRRNPQEQASAGPLWLRFSAAAGLGLGLSAFFWLPAFAERRFIRLAGITEGFFDFRHNFVTLPELLALPQPLDLGSINPYFPLSLGVAQCTLAILGFAAILSTIDRFRPGRKDFAGTANLPGPNGQDRGFFAESGNRGPFTILFGAAFLVFSFLTLPQSTPLWEAVPLLELAEFPWRLLGPALLCAAFLAGAAVWAIQVRMSSPRLRPLRIPLFIAGLLLVIGANLPYLFPDQFIEWGTPGPGDVMAYEIDSGAIGTTSTGEFLPAWTDRFPSPQVFALPTIAARNAGTTIEPIPHLEPDTLPAGSTVETLSRTSSTLLLRVEATAPFPAHFRLLYWPGWRVFVSDALGTSALPRRNEVTDTSISSPEGLLSAQLPAGRYLVSLRLTDTSVRSASNIMSIVAVLAALGLAIARVFFGRWTQTTGPLRLPGFTWRQAGGLTAGVILAALLVQPLAPWFVRRSLPGQVLGAQHQVQATLGDSIRLLAFDGPPPTLQAGWPISAVLYWQATTAVHKDYRVFLHLDGPDGTTYASADQLNPADIPTSNWPPGLFVRNPLTLDLPETLPPIRYTLTAGLYDHHTGARLPVTECVDCHIPTPAGVDAVPLAHVWVLPRELLTAQGVPNPAVYRVGPAVELLGHELGTRSTSGDAQLVLYWRTDAVLPTDYTVFVHALDTAGSVLRQFDAPPCAGQYPSSAWLPGQIIADVHEISLTTATRTLSVGLYDPTNQTRLPVVDANAVEVSGDTVTIQVSNAQ